MLANRSIENNLLYSSVMPRQQKTPQQKKQLELKKDHFTFAKNPHAFPQGLGREESRSEPAVPPEE
jgi:hypothetical protein